MTMVNDNAVLHLENINRIFPRDITDISSAILKEMLLPRSQIGKNNLNTFHALKDINLILEKNQKLGIIGSHHSGKTMLANIASGLLHPSSGKVSVNGSRLLFSRPTAGFKPALTVLENLSFRASLLGLHGIKLDDILESTLSQCGMSLSVAQQPIGNLSPYVIKQLAFYLLLSIETDIVIIDELISAGSGDIRQATRSQLQDKIEKCSSLIISSDLSFLKETTTHSFILTAGQLLGPYETLDAIAGFNQLQLSGFNGLDEDDEGFASQNDQSTYVIEEDLVDAQEIALDDITDKITPTKRKAAIASARIFSITSLEVDGDNEYSHSKYSLLKRTGEFVEVEMELIANCKALVKGGKFELIKGSTGSIFAQTNIEWPTQEITLGANYQVKFSFQIPENKGDFFGLAFTPLNISNKPIKESQLKILILGTGNAKKKVQNEISMLNVEFNKLCN